MKKAKLLLVAIAMMASYSLLAQMAITADGSSADASAMLEVKSTKKGLLIPNVTLTGTTDASTISTPAVSLLVYNTATVSDVTPGYYYNAGTTGSPVWTRFSSPGTSPGQMQYWNGTAWVTVARGSSGQVLTFINGVPTWGVSISAGLGEVQNPITGAIWLDRNLGATQVAISSTDADSYGDLYQWGRGTDGHQIRTSATTSTLSSKDVPGHGNFILAPDDPYNWLSTQNTNLWQGVSGINNPCPTGYRIPTDLELVAEIASWSSQNAAGAFASPLKLPVSGARNSSDGSLIEVGSQGAYWSSTIDGTDSRGLYFGSDDADTGGIHRAYGFSIRCIKD